MRLVGRETEFQFLNGVLSETQRGHTNIVVVSGHPEIGKTALLQGLSESIDAEAITEIRGCYVPGATEFRDTLYSRILTQCHDTSSRITNSDHASVNGAIDQASTFADNIDKYEVGSADFSR